VAGGDGPGPPAQRHLGADPRPPEGAGKGRLAADQFPEFEFVTRTIGEGGKPTCGVWARLKVAPPPPTDAPTGNGIGEPELG
jgi:hypothetical protein